MDRSVTGLVAQQPCVGPLQLPLANCAVVAQSHWSRAAVASAVGEQPLKGLLDPAAMARLAVAEMVQAHRKQTERKEQKMEEIKEPNNVV